MTTSGAANLLDLTKALQTIIPAVVPQTTNESSTTTAAPAAIDLSNKVAAQALATSTNPQDALVNNILMRAQLSFGASLGEEKSAGLYDTTTENLLRNEAIARATGESASAVLAAQTAGTAEAGKQASSQLAASKTSAASKTVQPTLGKTAGSLISSLLLGSAAKKGFDKLTSKAGADDSNNGPEQLAGPGSGYTPPAADASEAFSTTGGTSAEAGGTELGTTPVFGVDTPAINPDSLALNDTGTMTDAAPESLVATPEQITASQSAAADPTGTAEALGAGGVAGAGVGSIAEDVGFPGADTAGVGSVASDVIGSNGGADLGLETVAEATWIICTELHKQGRIPSRIYYGAASEFLNYSSRGKRGYYIWAIPSTKHLRTHPNSVYSKCLNSIFNCRAKYIFNRKYNKPVTITGAIVTHSLYAFCWSLSWFVPKSLADYKQVYN